MIRLHGASSMLKAFNLIVRQACYQRMLALTTQKDTGLKMVYLRMENMFHQKRPTRTYDRKRRCRNRFASKAFQNVSHVLLDSNFLEFTKGQPLIILHRIFV